MSNAYVCHVCKNSKLEAKDPNYCNNAWIDKDLTNATTIPPRWKYCPECEKKGFKNPKKTKRTMTPEQIEAFKERMKEYRKNKNEQTRTTK